MQRQQARIAHTGQLLTALSYKSVLTRGFALVRDERGHAVRAAAAVGPGARLNLEFADGSVGATADADRPAVAATRTTQTKLAGEAKPAAPGRVTKPVDQGSLF
jgi:exodeoxyribonuclease VII large subunit